MKNNLVFLIALTLVISCNTQRKKGPVPREYYPEFSYQESRGYHPNRPAQIGSNEQRHDLTPVIDQEGNSGIKKDSERRIKSRAGKRKQSGNVALNNGQDHHQSSGHAGKGVTEKVPEVEKQKDDGDSDLYLYLMAGLMGASSFGLLRRNRKTAFKASRWAKAHKIKTRVLILLMHMGLGTLGVLTGKEFHELGYGFSDHSQYIFSGLLALSFLSLFVKKGGENMTMLNEFDRMKLGHLGVSLSFFLLTLGIGNRIEQGQKQISPLGYAVESIHHSYSGEQGLSHAPSIQESNAVPAADTTGLIVLYVLLAMALTLLLAIICCAAVCSGDEVLAIGVVIGSILLLTLVIGLMITSVRRRELQ